MKCYTDTEILNWLENNAGKITFHEIDAIPLGKSNGKNGYWRKIFGRKDETNRFHSLREAVAAQLDDAI